jgi:hypothetical protein
MSHSDTQKLFNNLRFIIINNIPQIDNIRQLILENGGEVQIALENFHELREEGAYSDHIYVVDKFEGELFKYLTDISAKVVGVPFIYQTVSMRRPPVALENVGPLIIYSRIMEGIEICTTRLRREKREDVKKMIQYMGGTHRDEITGSTQLLLAGKVGSVKYQIAVNRNIPILDPTWILKCWDTQTLVDYRNYILPPFAGLLICVTGLSSSTRDEIQRLTKAYGGDYTPNLSRKVTHLIAEKPTGIKYRYALEWGIFCVSMEWFFDSINFQVCADERHYFLPLDEETKDDVLSPTPTPIDLKHLSPKLRRRHSPFQPSTESSSISRFSSYSLYSPNDIFRSATAPKSIIATLRPPSAHVTPFPALKFVVRPLSLPTQTTASPSLPFNCNPAPLSSACPPNSLTGNCPATIFPQRLPSFIRVGPCHQNNRYQPYESPLLFTNHTLDAPPALFQGNVSENNKVIIAKNSSADNNNNLSTPSQQSQQSNDTIISHSSQNTPNDFSAARMPKKRKSKAHGSAKKKRVSNKKTFASLVCLQSTTTNNQNNRPDISSLLAPLTLNTNQKNLFEDILKFPRGSEAAGIHDPKFREQIANAITKDPKGPEIVKDLLWLVHMCDNAIQFYRNLDNRVLSIVLNHLGSLQKRNNGEITVGVRSEQSAESTPLRSFEFELKNKL